MGLHEDEDEKQADLFLTDCHRSYTAHEQFSRGRNEVILFGYTLQGKQNGGG